MRSRICALIALTFVMAACSDDRSPSDNSQAVQLALERDVAPPHLVVDGRYSDLRFVEMMAAHHQHAVDMAKVAAQHASRAEVRSMAQKMIDDQEKEIEDLRSLRRSLDGSDHLPMMMAPHSMENSGVPMPDELHAGASVDAAFLDGMLPHHSGAVEMSSVALRHTDDARIAKLARRIIDAQAREIGEIIGLRTQWFAGLNHGFPHASK